MSLFTVQLDGTEIAPVKEFSNEFVRCGSCCASDLEMPAGFWPTTLILRRGMKQWTFEKLSEIDYPRGEGTGCAGFLYVADGLELEVYND